MASRLAKGSAIAAAAIALVGAWEGLRTKAYIPIPGDIPTICFGSTKGVRLGDTKTIAECKDLLREDLITHELGMRKCLKFPDAIPEKVYVASLSLAFNVGVGTFCRSTVARRLNEGNYRAACDAIPLFNRAGGRVIQGLVNRRNEERKICLAGV